MRVGIDAPAPAARVLGIRGLSVAGAIVIVPGVVFAILHADPDLNVLYIHPVPHFFVVTIVALFSAGVALLVARAAIRLEQRTVLLVALGFMAMRACSPCTGLRPRVPWAAATSTTKPRARCPTPGPWLDTPRT